MILKLFETKFWASNSTNYFYSFLHHQINAIPLKFVAAAKIFMLSHLKIFQLISNGAQSIEEYSKYLFKSLNRKLNHY